MPQQSDYVAIWAADGKPAPAVPSQLPGRSALVRAALRITPESIKQVAKLLLGFKRRWRRFDPRFFRKMSWEEELSELGSEVGDGE